MKTYCVLFTIVIILLITNISIAQDRPIGYWRSHLPYNTAVSIATDGISMFVATEKTFYTNNNVTSELTPYSKVEGMADVGMSYVAYDNVTGTTILGYKNSNIDLFKDGNFFNLPDLKLKSVTGTKNINHIYTDDGLAYLSTDIGIVVLNLAKKEVKETYSFSKNNTVISIKEVTIQGNNLYAITSAGLFYADKNSKNIQAFSSWKQLDTVHTFISIKSFQNKIFALAADSLYALENDKFTPIYYSADSSLNTIDSGINGLWITEYYKNKYTGKAIKMDTGFHFIDSFIISGYAKKLIEFSPGVVFIADQYRGLRQRFNPDSTDNYGSRPDGPNTYSSWDIWVNNKELWVAHGGVDQFYRFTDNGFGFSQFKNDKWTNYERYLYPPFGDSTRDFTNIIKGPDGNVYAGSTQSGLFVLKPDGGYEIYRGNSIFDDSYSAPGHYRVSGFAFDHSGNLWMTLFATEHELVVKTKEGNWFKFFVPYQRLIPHSANNIIVDDNDLKWYACPGGGGGGIIVYDDNKTPEDPSDDRYKQLVNGKGAGNLPDNDVFCLANDKSGAIWVGTANGIGIINCPSEVIAGNCEAEQRIVQYDQFAGYLFQNEVVKTIAVDGANRKWIGTNNGVWLISSDGNQIINRFTADNSPLPSNVIQKIAIDGVTGDVYIGTDEGLVSYRGLSTEGGTENNSVVTFPNPIPSGYGGTIAIKGLVENADVRITDITGQLIYRTKALGGQATWNGMDYRGKRPESGVYLIFITNKDGSQTHVGKMVFMN